MNEEHHHPFRPPVVFLYFSGLAPEQLVLELDEIAARFQLGQLDQTEWLFPDEVNCLVMIRFEPNISPEYDDVTRESLAEEVGSAPSVGLRLFLNTRKPNHAADAATAVTLHLLGKFFGVAEDGSDEHLIWTASEVRDGRRGTRFLAHFRTRT